MNGLKASYQAWKVIGIPQKTEQKARRFHVLAVCLHDLRQAVSTVTYDTAPSHMDNNKHTS